MTKPKSIPPKKPLTIQEKVKAKIEKDKHATVKSSNEKVKKITETKTPFLTKLNKLKKLPDVVINYNSKHPHNQITIEQIKNTCLELAVLSTNNEIENSVWEIDTIHEPTVGTAMNTFDYLVILAVCSITHLPIQSSMRQEGLFYSLWRGYGGGRFESVRRSHELVCARKAELHAEYSMQQLPADPNEIPDEFYEETRNGGKRLSMSAVRYMEARKEMHWRMAESSERKSFNRNPELVVKTIVQEQKAEAMNLDLILSKSVEELSKDL